MYCKLLERELKSPKSCSNCLMRQSCDIPDESDDISVDMDEDTISSDFDDYDLFGEIMEGEDNDNTEFDNIDFGY